MRFESLNSLAYSNLYRCTCCYTINQFFLLLSEFKHRVKLFKNLNLYFISIYELLNGISSDKIYINGLIKKYFPNLNDKTILDITKNKKPTKKKIKEIEKQRRCLEIYNDTSNLIYNNSDSNTDEFHFKFIKINNDDSKNDVDIVKIFAKSNTSINVPFIKLYLNDFTESYYKLYNDYYKKFIVDSDKIYSWIKNKPIVIIKQE